MKNLVVLLIVLVFSGFGFAQSSSNSGNEEVSVIYASYQMRGNQNKQKTYSKAPYIQVTNESSNAGPAPHDSIQYTKQLESINLVNPQEFAVVKFKNNTQKKVASIEYNFIVVRNKDGKELKKYTLANNSNVRAGETKTLSSVVVGADRLAMVSYKAKITRVKYSDGSIWIP